MCLTDVHYALLRSRHAVATAQARVRRAAGRRTVDVPEHTGTVSLDVDHAPDVILAAPARR